MLCCVQTTVVHNGMQLLILCGQVQPRVFVFLEKKVCLYFCVFCVCLNRFGCVLSTLVLLGLVCSIRSQKIDWNERFRNDLFCVEWGVKPCSV